MIWQTLIEATGNLLAAWRRSRLGLIGIVVGAGEVIAMLHAGTMARQETIRQFRQIGIYALILRADSRRSLIPTLPDRDSLWGFPDAGAM